jgi:flagellar motor protein MotB
MRSEAKQSRVPTETSGRNQLRIIGLALVLVCALVMVGCVSGMQYRKENEMLKMEINRVNRENDGLKQEVNTLHKHNEKLYQQIRNKSDYSSMIPSQKDLTPLTNKLKEKGLEVVIRDGSPAVIVSNVFDPGAETLSKDGKAVLKKVALAILAEIPICPLRVDGYTDNEPIVKHKDKYKNNEELSSARAKYVANFLVNECGFDKNNVESRGLGAANPIADNKTAAGRDKNRRVELVILIK